MIQESLAFYSRSSENPQAMGEQNILLVFCSVLLSATALSVIKHPQPLCAVLRPPPSASPCGERFSKGLLQEGVHRSCVLEKGKILASSGKHRGLWMFNVESRVLDKKTQTLTSQARPALKDMHLEAEPRSEWPASASLVWLRPTGMRANRLLILLISLPCGLFSLIKHPPAPALAGRPVLLC